VPLLVSVPWLMAEGEGRKDSSIVELVDLYPTIANLLGHQGLDSASLSVDRDSEEAGLFDREEQGRLHGTCCRGMCVLWL
jgi:arylsulfatase A-like enzyme